ncbi:MAG: glycosyltransferase family 2 protein, partial [Acidobacteriota bacterium]
AGPDPTHSTQVSAVIITCNEEANIGRALASLSWADEIVVLDSGSSDRTCEIAGEAGARVEQAAFAGFVQQKNAVVDLATHDWILSLDSDEEISSELQREIEFWKNTPKGNTVGYRVPRVVLFLGQWIRCTSWYPDYQLRLFRRSSCRWHGGRVHESVRLLDKASGESIGYLKGEIRHYSFPSMSAYIRRLDCYTTLAALDRRDRGEKASAWKLLVDPAAAFIRNYILDRGFRGGMAGLAVSLLSSFYVLVRNIKLWELRQKTDCSP